MADTPDKSVEEQKAEEQITIKNLGRQLVEARKDALPLLKVAIQNMSGVQINADPIVHPDIFENEMRVATGSAIEHVVSAASEEDFKKEFLNLMIRGDGQMSPEESIELMQIFVKSAQRDVSASSSADERKNHDKTVLIRDVATKVVELYQKRNGYGDEQLIKLRKEVGLLPPDELNPAPVQSSGNQEGKNPPPAPGQDHQKPDQDQPTQPNQENKQFEYKGVPLQTEADFEEAANQMKTDMEDAIKRGDKAAVQKMLGQAKNWMHSAQSERLKNGAFLILCILGVAYIAGLWVATRYRGGGK